MQISVIYDNFCPICQRVMMGTRLKNAGHNLEMIKAREEPLNDIQGVDCREFDLDESFVLVVDGEPYLGAEAAYMLSVLSTGNGTYYRLFKWLTAHRSLSKASYPLLVRGRRYLLKLLKIPEFRENQD